MYEPVFPGSNTNMGVTGTPAIPENNSLNYSAASSTASQEHKKLFAAYSRTPAQRNTYSGSSTGKGKGKGVPTCTLSFSVFHEQTHQNHPLLWDNDMHPANTSLHSLSMRWLWVLFPERKKYLTDWYLSTLNLCKSCIISNSFLPFYLLSYCLSWNPFVELLAYTRKRPHSHHPCPSEHVMVGHIHLLHQETSLTQLLLYCCQMP